MAVTQPFILTGSTPYDRLGAFVSSAGDVNGDGIDDFIMGLGLQGQGGACVVYGQVGGIGSINLSALSPTQGFQILGEAGANAGPYMVASPAGDVNGDGYGDIILGAEYYAGVATFTGRAYIVYGHATSGTVDLGNMNGSQGTILEAPSNFGYGAQFGEAVANAGDVNGDGYDDVLIGAPQAVQNNQYIGSAYLLFGSASGIADTNFDSMTPAQGIKFTGTPGSSGGFDVAGLGDINGDGIDDFAITAPQFVPNGPGGVYVYFGKASGLTSHMLVPPAAGEGFVINAVLPSKGAGFSIAAAGDVNGDGFQDLIFSQASSPAAYVIFGHAGGFSAVDLSNLSPSQGVKITWPDSAGQSNFVAHAGDVNGDGFDDLIVSDSLSQYEVQGVMYVIPGSASFGPVDLSTFNGVTLTVPDPADQAAKNTFWQVFDGAGDINNDGLADLVVGSAGGPNFEGKTYIYYGVEATSPITRIGTVASQSLVGGGGNDQLFGMGGNDKLYGHAGTDQLDGGDGNDRLDGGAGADHMAGGTGDDTYVVDDPGDQVVENPNEGNDTVESSITYTLPDNVENLTLTGTTAINGIGNALDNVIYGNSADNTLDGAAGNDTIDGGAGNDTITGGAGLDIIHGGAGSDTVNIGFGDFVAGEVYDAGADGGRLVVAISATPLDFTTATITSFTELSGGNVKMTAAQFLQFSAITGSWVTLTDGGTITGSVFITPLYNTVINLAPVDTVFNAVRSLGAQGDGALTINGNIGNDTIYGTDLNDSLNGGGGNDTIYGGGGADYLTGGNGNDVLDGGGSFDDMAGGLGDDTYYVDNNSDVVHENVNEGYDTEIGSISFVLADNVEHGILSGGGELFGNGGDNWLTGGPGGSTLYGLGGNDRLDGSAAADTLIGGTGDDTYVLNGADTIVEKVGEGNDTIESATTASLTSFANVENLTLTGNAAINGTGDANGNVIRGNSAANTLDGGGGADKLYGGGGDDTYIVNNAGVQVFENANEGADTVRSSVTFTLGANVENLVLTGTGNINGTGNSGQNIITGNAGSNQLDGGGGGDTLQGGAGNDVYYIRNAADVIVEGAGEGTADTVLASVSYTLGASAQVERLAASDSNATVALNLTGNAYSHLIQGNAGVNVLTGGTGNDNLFGYAGDDRLVGGQGADQMTGGVGNDTYVVDNAGDVVIENSGEGTDTVESSIGYTLGANVENLTLTGGLAIDGTGNAGANVIHGNSAANMLNGGGGADTLYGGGGDDTFIVDNAGVQIVENTNEGTDTVRSSLSYTLGANLENLVLTGTGNINGYGNAGQNMITGNAGSNQLDGGGGGDTLQGGAGNDVYYVRNAGDVIVENAGEGTADTVLASVSYTLTAAAQVERLSASDSNLTNALNLTGNAWSHLIQGNAGVNTLTGGSGSDTLYGYAGDDRLDGGQGTDTLYGGVGNDTYVVDSLSDVIVENAGEGTDTVEASISYSLAALANVENLTLTGSSAIDGTGNALDNVIRGNSAANTLNGGTGNDMLYGGAGDDTYVIGDAHAKVVELAGEGSDTVQASVNYSLAGTSNIETLMLTGSAVSATGNAEHNILIGTAGSNTLDGGGGGDTLQGGAGNDVYYIRNAADVIVEGTGEGTADTVLATVSYTLSANAQVERLAASDSNATVAINLTGNAYSHLIQGNNGANTLTGGSGADTLMGYGGNDTLFGGSGADKFVFAHGTGQDIIGDFVAGTDKIDLTAIGFASYQDVINATHDVGGNAVIDLGNGDQLTLTGVTSAQLHSGDFIGVGNAAAAVQMQPFALSFATVDAWHGGVDTISAFHG
jgi:Ca2+-binding RTX toxin-like protein